MTVVVTGASGHLGGNLVRALLEQGRRVRAVYNSDKRALDGLEVEHLQADVRDPEAMRKALDGAEVLYHFAAFISIDGGHKGKVRSVNVDGVKTVMNAALQAGVRRVVHCSSIHAFDLNTKGAPIDERSDRACPDKQGAYDCSKADGERELRAVIERGLDAVVVNPTGVIGPLDFKPSRMGDVFLKLYHRRLPALIPGGFDFVDVRDVVSSALAAEEKGRTGENYILSGRWHSVREIADTAKKVTGVKPPRFSSPMPLARVGAPFATAFARLTKTQPLFTAESLAALRANREISHAKAREELGHDPRSLEASVEDIYAWFDAFGKLKKKGR